MMQTSTINRFYRCVTLFRGGFGVGQAAILAKSAWVCCDERQPSGPSSLATARLKGLLDGRTYLCVDNSVSQRTARAKSETATPILATVLFRQGIVEAEFSNANPGFRNGKSVIGNAISEF